MDDWMKPFYERFDSLLPNDGYVVIDGLYFSDSMPRFDVGSKTNKRDHTEDTLAQIHFLGVLAEFFGKNDCFLFPKKTIDDFKRRVDNELIPLRRGVNKSIGRFSHAKGRGARPDYSPSREAIHYRDSLPRLIRAYNSLINKMLSVESAVSPAVSVEHINELMLRVSAEFYANRPSLSQALYPQGKFSHNKIIEYLIANSFALSYSRHTSFVSDDPRAVYLYSAWNNARSDIFPREILTLPDYSFNLIATTSSGKRINLVAPPFSVPLVATEDSLEKRVDF